MLRSLDSPARQSITNGRVGMVTLTLLFVTVLCHVLPRLKLLRGSQKILGLISSGRLNRNDKEDGAEEK
jgi:hypothetical protein